VTPEIRPEIFQHTELKGTDAYFPVFPLFLFLPHLLQERDLNICCHNLSNDENDQNEYPLWGTAMKLPDAIWHVIRVCGGCGVLDLNGPEVDCLLCQRGGFVPYWGPRGALIQYLICKKNIAPKVEKYSYSEYIFLYSVKIILSKTIISVNNHCFIKKVILL
jgi:hypothetical protein